MSNIAWITQSELDSKLRIIPKEVNTGNQREQKERKTKNIMVMNSLSNTKLKRHNQKQPRSQLLPRLR